MKVATAGLALEIDTSMTACPVPSRREKPAGQFDNTSGKVTVKESPALWASGTQKDRVEVIVSP